MTPADQIASIAREVSATWGMPGLAGRVDIATDGDCIRVHLASDEMSGTRFSVAIDDTLAGDLRDRGGRAMDLRVKFSEMVRLEARAARIPEHDPSRAPAWSLALPRLFRDLLTSAGTTAADVVAGMDDYSGWEPADVGTNTQLSSVSIRSGRLLGTLRLTSGTCPVSVISEDDEDGACTVVIHDLDLPETALLGLHGVGLDRVVDHPGIARHAGHVVRQLVARTSGGSRSLHLMLEPDHVWGADAPEGQDLSWRSIREGRRLPRA